MVRNQINAVRALSGMQKARAIVVVESNQAFVADDIYAHLRSDVPVENHLPLFLTPTFSNKRNLDGTPANEHGEMLPGLRTWEKNKPRMLEMTSKLLEEKRLLRLQTLIAYATPNADYEERLLHKYRNDVALLCHKVGAPAPSETDVARAGDRLIELPVMRAAFTASAVADMLHLLPRQWKNMSRIPRVIRRANGSDVEERISVKYSGKIGGGRTPENKDDLVMAFGVGLMGALAFYTLPEFIRDRSAVGVSH